MNATPRDSWSSNLGFLLAAMGSAIGLGTIWRFPYSLGVSGGGAYILVYLLAVCLVALPILAAEMVIGRRGQRSPPESMEKLAREAGGSPAWRYAAVAQFLGAFVVLAFYCVVGGWTLAYIPKLLLGEFVSSDPVAVQAVFDGLNASPVRLAFWHAAFLGLTVVISAGGVRAGVERASSVLMPLFFLLLAGMAIYASSVGELGDAARFLFLPDFSKITPAVVLNALGQAFFSIGAGSTVYIAYASYAGPGLAIGRSAWLIVLAVAAVSVVAGMAVFPIVFQYGLDPASGPGLAFVTLPLAFVQMPGGEWFGTAFFFLLFVAALTSSISMLEVTVSWATERFGVSRTRTAAGCAFVSWLIGLPALLSFNIWSGVHPLGMLPVFASKTFFDLFDYFAANILLPAGGLCMAIFAGWVLGEKVFCDELGGAIGGVWPRVCRWLLRYLTPVALAVIFFYLILS